MDSASYFEVSQAQKALEDAKNELSDNTSFQHSIATINEIIGTLSSVWTTEGGQESISKIGKLIDGLDDFSDLDTLVSNIKSAEIKLDHTQFFNR